MSPFSLQNPWRNTTAEKIANCYEPERNISSDERSEWSFVTATLYGFGIVTTLGYNRIAPITYAGRLFCIVYGICGIPITMIIIANVGQYLNNFASDSRRKLEAYRTQRRMSRASISGKEYKESSIQVTSLALLIAFLIYVAMGALLLPALNGQEGREPPDDTNDEVEQKYSSVTHQSPSSPKELSDQSSSESSPFLVTRSLPDNTYNFADLVIKNPVFHTLSSEMPLHSPPATEQVFCPPVEVCRVKVQEQNSINEVEERHVIIIEPPTTLENVQIMESTPVVPFLLTENDVPTSNSSRAHSLSISPEERVPRKFKEKKEMYGRDPRKLFETYQEEWDRLERHGARRKSVLNLHGYEEGRSPSNSSSMNAIFRT
ncbi:Ion channel [Dictyocaulus viviparus]|uniref:Ion channel n=1 Tax=Dictyocaulus viviparus TaxID=29172 RepID=A0A0D8XCX6_DICVI|nr:Ion channel [Dictyocaulus viviparus]